METERVNYDIYTKSEIMHMMRQSVVDEYSILKYEGEQFIIECYQWLFNREPDQSGLKSYMSLMQEGLPRQGIIYLLAKSEEFNHRFEISRLREFKEAYLKYEWDVKSLLGIDDELEFVEKCYEILLERQPDLAGYMNFINLLIQGAPKAAVISIMAHSDEIKNVKTIRDVEYFDNIYENYKNVSKRINIFRKIKLYLTANKRLENKLNRLYLTIARTKYELKYMEKQKL